MRVRVALGLSATAVVVSLGSIGYTAVNNANRVDDIDRVSQANGALLVQIQGQRVANTRRACEDQNDSNARVYNEFLELSKDSAAKQGAKLTAEQKRTIRKIADAIAERRDCDAVVKRQTGSAPPSPS